MAKRGQIRLGSYYAADSPIHRLDPRAKLLGMMAFLLAVLCADKFWTFAVVYIAGAALFRLAHIPLANAFRAVRGLVALLALTCLINMFFTAGDTVLWQWGFLRLTAEGLERSALMLLRLVALVSFAGLLTFTTTPIALSDALEKLLSPLQRFGFPAHELAMMMTIALRFIPILLEEANKIMKAQRSRGGDLTTGSLMKRCGGLVAILIPLLFNALKRADDLAIAMEARAYTGGENRTCLRELVWHKTDTAYLLVMAGFLAFMLVSCRLGGF